MGGILMDSNNLNKKPFLKKWWLIGIGVVLVVFLIGVMNRNEKGKNDVKELVNIEWNNLTLNEFLPEPSNPYGEVSVDNSMYMTIVLHNVDNKYIDDYKKSCIDGGYTIESEDKDQVYEAFNQEGFKLRLLFFEENQLTIELSSPEIMNEISWPTSGLGTLLPSTKSTYGRISFDNETTFIVHVGNTSLDDFNEYAELCKNNGFSNKYVKEEKFVNAFNENGYELTMRYLGFNTIEIALKNETEKNNSELTEENKNEENKNGTSIKDEEEQTTPSSDNDETQNNDSNDTDKNKDIYADGRYEQKALLLFRRTGEAQYPYGIEYHWLTGGIANEYQGNGNYYFRVRVTVKNEYGTKRKGIATGYVDIKTNYIDFSVGLD